LAVTVSSTLTTANQRQLINVDATSGAITITLPAAATVGSGWAVQIRKADVSANLVTISRSGTDLINGVVTLPLAVQHQSFILFSLGGTSWGVVAGFDGTLPANSLLGTGATPGMVGVIPSNTFASLVGGVIPATQLPSFVDDVLEFVALANFPATGEAGKIYVATGTGITYRWSGTTYVEISASLALGITSATAYRGDFGNTAYLHSQVVGNVHGVTAAQVGLGNLTNHLQVNTTEAQTIGGEKTFANIVRITNTTQSTSTTTGAQQIAGGLGVVGNGYFGGILQAGGRGVFATQNFHDSVSPDNHVSGVRGADVNIDTNLKGWQFITCLRPDNVNYGAQLALCDTQPGLKYRNKSNGIWGTWNTIIA